MACHGDENIYSFYSEHGVFRLGGSAFGGNALCEPAYWQAGFLVRRAEVFNGVYLQINVSKPVTKAGSA